MKYVYHYDPVSQIYIGKEPADPSPREKGVFLLPAYATFEKPDLDNEKVAVFDQELEQWNYLEDNRGIYYVNNGHGLEEITITNLGDPVPHNAINEKEFNAIMYEREWRDLELERTDKFMLRDYPIGFLKRRKVIKYRRDLRNWPASKHFPDKGKRPQIS